MSDIALVVICHTDNNSTCCIVDNTTKPTSGLILLDIQDSVLLMFPDVDARTFWLAVPLRCIASIIGLTSSDYLFSKRH